MSRRRSSLCVIQARTGSTRLPGKVLQDLGGRPLLRFMLDRLADLRVDELVVATSSLDRDDPVAEIARDAGRPVVRGSERDVLDRFATALAVHPAEHVVRLTADCPLADPVLIESVLGRHLDRGADYTSNVFPRTFPRGLDCEVMTAAALHTAHAEATDAAEREHVTPFLYRRPERFALANMRNDVALGREGWTVDTAEDLAFVRGLTALMPDDAFSWREAWAMVGHRTPLPLDEVVLVPAGREHGAFFLACRNDPDAVRHSRSHRMIGREEHTRWFGAKVDDPGVRLRVALVRGEAVGTVRVDVRCGVGEVGVAVAPSFRGQGLGTALLEALLDDVATDPQVVTLIAAVHAGNTASMRAFARVGFVADGADGDFRRLRHERVLTCLPGGFAAGRVTYGVAVRVLIVGAGGVGTALAIAANASEGLEHVVLTDLDAGRAQRALERVDGRHFVARALDASDQSAIAELARAERVDIIVNACDPRLNPPIFHAAFDAGCHYLDMAMTLSEPHPDRPYERPGRMLGEEQFEASDRWRERGLLVLVGMGVEPGLSDIFARWAAENLFSEIDEIGVRYGADLVVDGYDFAPTFSIWTTIEECLNPPLVWERERGFFTLPPFSEPETFVFPEGIGPIECVHVEHEEVLLIPKCVDCRRVTFKYGLGDEFINVLQTLYKTGLSSTTPVNVRGVDVSPRDVVAAVLPDPATLGDRMHGRTCAGTWVTGKGLDGAAREVYLYHLSDNAETMARHGSQAVVWQTAINPAIALELLAAGTWQGAGVLGPEAFDPGPFLDRLRDRGEFWHVDERAV